MAKKRQFPLLAFLVIALVAIILLGSAMSKISSVKNEGETTAVSKEHDLTQTVSTTEEQTTVEETKYFEQPDVPKPDYPEGWKEYVNEEHGYSFAYPKTVYTNGNAHETFISTDFEFRDEIYVTARGFGGFGGVKVLEERVEEAYNERMQYYTTLAIPFYLVKDEVVDFNGYTTRSLTFERTDYPHSSNNVFLIEHKGKTYVLGWSSSNDNLRELNYASLGESILSTFHLN